MSAVASEQVDLKGGPQTARFFFSAFAVALGLGVIFGFLTFLREPPSGDFHAEWAALVFFACAAVLVVPVLPRRFVVNPSLVAVPLVLAAVLAVQLALGRYEYMQYPLFWGGYLALALLAMLVGQGVRAAGLLPEVVQRLAWALVIAGVLNCGIQIIQAIRLESAFAPFVLRLVEGACRPYGNVGQPNQAATLAWLGLASVLYLTAIGRLSSLGAAPVIVVLLIGAGLSASRMAFLFLGLTVSAVVFLRAWPVKAESSRRLIAAMLVGGFAVASIGAGFALSGISQGCASGIERLADRQEGGLVVRFELWRQALNVWRTSPWIGVGAFNFLPTVYSIESLSIHRPLDTYTHNAGLQILAEFGIAGAAALATVLVIWLRKLVTVRRVLDAHEAVIALWLSIIGAHSMLEFPLWYTYFLALFCLGLGMIVRPEWSRLAPELPLRIPLIAIATALTAVAVAVFVDYRKLDRLYWLEDQRAAFSAAPTAEVRKLIGAAADDVWLFRIQADHLLGLSQPINAEDLQQKIADTDRLLAVSPQPAVAVRRVALAILDNDHDTARFHLRRLFVFFPRHAEVFARSLRNFVLNRPTEFAALGTLLEEELARRPEPRW